MSETESSFRSVKGRPRLVDRAFSVDQFDVGPTTGYQQDPPRPRRPLEAGAQYPSLSDYATVTRIQAETINLLLDANRTLEAEFVDFRQETRTEIAELRAALQAVLAEGPTGEVTEPDFDDAVRLLRTVPLEDGMTHPAEGVIHRLTDHAAMEVAAKCKAIVEQSDDIAGDLLRVVSRVITSPSATWYAVAANALESADIVLRDAAVVALESWGTEEAREILAGHLVVEPVAWLKDHIEQTLDELE